MATRRSRTTPREAAAQAAAISEQVGDLEENADELSDTEFDEALEEIRGSITALKGDIIWLKEQATKTETSSSAAQKTAETVSLLTTQIADLSAKLTEVQEKISTNHPPLLDTRTETPAIQAPEPAAPRLATEPESQSEPIADATGPARKKLRIL